MSVIIIATVIPIPERRAEIIADLETAIPQVQTEDAGCELYALHEGEDRLVMIEKWASMDAIQAHGKSPGLAAFTAAIDGKLLSPMDVQFLSAHPLGSPEVGAL